MNASSIKHPQLVRSLGRWNIALLTIGSVIGSGVFLVPGQVAAAAGMNLTYVGLCWLFGGALSLCGAITYAELARVRPEAGGLYVYIRDGYGAVPAFVFGWMSLFVNTGGTVAALSAAAAGALHGTWLNSVPTSWLAVAFPLALGVLNLFPARRNGDFQGWTAALKYGAVMLFAVLLIVVAIRNGHAESGYRSVTQGAHRDLIVAVVGVLWAFEGWQYVTCAAGETVNARKAVAFGLLAGVSALTLLYLLASFSVTLWLSPTDLAAEPNVIQAALLRAGHPAVAMTVWVALPLAVLSAAHATLMTGSRVVYAMAVDRLLPTAFLKISPRTGVPVTAVLACTVVSSTLAAMGTFDGLLAYVVITSWLFYGLAGAAIFRIRARENDVSSRGVRFAALAFCIGAAGVIFFGWLNGPSAGRAGLLIVAVGWLSGVYWVRMRARGQAPAVGESSTIGHD